VTWYWCQGKHEIDFGIRTSLHDELITIKYFEEGGTFHSGTLLAEMKYTLRNPVEDISVSAHKIEIQETVQVRYKMAKIPTNCMIVGRCHGVRMFTHYVAHMEGECVIAMPRLPGIFEIACLATQQGENELALEKVTVTDQFHRSAVSLQFRGYATDHRILTIRPDQRFDLQFTGELLNAMDEVIVVEAKKLFEAPSHASLSFALQQKQIGEYGVCSLQIAKEGIYHICLALVHEHVMLLGDWCSVIVSNRVGSNTHPVPTEPIPTMPLIPMPLPINDGSMQPGSSGSPPSAGFICAICLDKTVCMKFDPCKHVCTCEGCCQLIMSHGIHACPLCKKTVTAFEKVFLA
jgi:hypothetical protein